MENYIGQGQYRLEPADPLKEVREQIQEHVSGYETDLLLKQRAQRPHSEDGSSGSSAAAARFGIRAAGSMGGALDGPPGMVGSYGIIAGGGNPYDFDDYSDTLTDPFGFDRNSGGGDD